MSETPRTDRFSFHLSSGREVTDAECARELERENANLREALTRITKIKWGWDGDCGAAAIAEDAL